LTIVVIAASINVILLSMRVVFCGRVGIFIYDTYTSNYDYFNCI